MHVRHLCAPQKQNGKTIRSFPNGFDFWFQPCPKYTDRVASGEDIKSKQINRKRKKLVFVCFGNCALSITYNIAANVTVTAGVKEGEERKVHTHTPFTKMFSFQFDASCCCCWCCFFILFASISPCRFHFVHSIESLI